MFDRLRCMTEQDRQAVHEGALEILGDNGMWFESPEAREIFRRHGHRIDGATVYFTSGQIESALKTVPAEFDVIAPNPDRRVHVGGGSLAYSSSASSTRILDPGGAVRPCTRDDYIDALKLLQALDSADFMFEYVVPNDMPGADHLLWGLFAQMNITDKPLSCQTIDGIGLLEIFYDTDTKKMRESARNGLAYGITFINPLSPLAMSAHESRKLIACAESGLAVALAPMSLAGMTAPCTLEGLITQQNAEILGALTLAQLVSPGAPVLYGCLGAITNMRNMMAPVGTPEGRLIEHAAAQMARFYQIPSRSLAGMTDSNEIDYQAGAESMLNFAMTARGGVNIITGLGSFANWMIASLEKLVLDAECVAYVKRLLRPMEFSPERLAVDVIKSVGAKGSYIVEDHTCEHFRAEFYNSAVFDRQPHDSFAAGGSRTCRDSAKTFIRETLAAYERKPLEQSLERRLRAYLEERGVSGSVSIQ